MVNGEKREKELHTLKHTNIYTETQRKRKRERHIHIQIHTHTHTRKSRGILKRDDQEPRVVPCKCIKWKQWQRDITIKRLLSTLRRCTYSTSVTRTVLSFVRFFLAFASLTLSFSPCTYAYFVLSSS